ncbi:hypothetical protein OIU84_024827 [Salix udensis]|uniref:Pentatricopeptide repeat-containing protein n=1 Tax=Salix udensis TaxID=889485 RepID=A0AAD6KI63_9ROSI|nr:hypothetical protein OIU84_024827 [Salix udensis]
MYSKCGKLSDARILFDEIPFRNIVAWTSLITGNAQNDDAHEALMVFKEFLMKRVKEHGEEVGNFWLILLLWFLFCRLVLVFLIRQSVREFMGVVMKVGLDKVMGVESTLLDEYIKCGEMNFPESNQKHPLPLTILVQLQKLMQMGNQAAPLQIALTRGLLFISTERLLSEVRDQLPSFFLIGSTMIQLNSFSISANVHVAEKMVGGVATLKIEQ